MEHFSLTEMYNTRLPIPARLQMLMFAPSHAFEYLRLCTTSSGRRLSNRTSPFSTNKEGCYGIQPLDNPFRVRAHMRRESAMCQGKG
jgi:hypothetical protein